MSTIDYNNGDQLASIATLLEINKTEIIGDVLKEIIKDPLYQDESGTYVWLETFKDWELKHINYDGDNGYFILEDGNDDNIIIRESMPACLVQTTKHFIKRIGEYYFFIHIN